MDERASGNLTKDSKVPQHALDTTGVAAYVRLQTLQKFVNKTMLDNLKHYRHRLMLCSDRYAACATQLVHNM